MRDQVYIKFAEALESRGRRKELVHVKFAEALDARMQKKALSLSSVKSMVGKALSCAGNGINRSCDAIGRLGEKMSPKIDASKWGKFDPRRLFVSTKKVPIDANNAVQVAVTPAGDAAYGAARGAPRTFDKLPNQGGFKDETRLSPAKILAALTGGTGIGLLASRAGTGAGDADPVKAPQVDSAAMKKLLLALGIGTGVAGGAAAAGYAVGSSGKKGKKKDRG